MNLYYTVTYTVHVKPATLSNSVWMKSEIGAVETQAWWENSPQCKKRLIPLYLILYTSDYDLTDQSRTQNSHRHEL